MHEQQANRSGQVLAKFLQEYYKLATLPELSERDAERMAAILELARVDRELDFWLSKIDHLVAEELEEDSSDSNQPVRQVAKQISPLTIQEKQTDENQNLQFKHWIQNDLSFNSFVS